MTTYSDFQSAIDHAYNRMKASTPHHRGKWQGVDVSRKPEAITNELHHYVMQVPMSLTDLNYYRETIKPNLPWADDHFAERVGGHPLNPGVEWRNWPWGVSADRSRIDPVTVGDPTQERIFDHTYAMRYWPKHAGQYPRGIIPSNVDHTPVHRGIYYDYGDLGDVVEELRRDPTTRQAILPVFFPEDTGYRLGRRKPCSLFYHFMRVNSSLDISYQLRSCDMAHHFRDDIYLTVRLLLWVLDELKKTERSWGQILPGTFCMMIANLHMFRNDYIQLTRGAT